MLRSAPRCSGLSPLLVAVAAVAFTGCGYHFAGATLGVPDDVHSLRVGAISNQSREQGLDKSLAFALEREIQTRRHFHMATDPGAADAVLSGTIRDLRTRAVAFGSNDIAVQYELALVLDVRLERQRDGHIIWQVTALRETDEYSANSQVVVTSSSEFQRQTLDAGNLPCQQGSTRPCNPEFSNLQMAETLRQRAITRLLGQASRDVYNQMVEGF